MAAAARLLFSARLPAPISVLAWALFAAVALQFVGTPSIARAQQVQDAPLLPLAAQPNDLFDQASSLTIPSTVTGSTSGATVEIGESTPCGIASTVWFRLTPSLSAPVRASTTGSGFDTGLALYQRSAYGLDYLDCNDDFGGTRQSQVSASLVAGRTYYLQVGGFAGASGTYSLSVTGLATLSASPNPVPAGSGPGTTTITWNTGDGSVGLVYVSQDGSPESLFAQGSSGSQSASWITPGSVYSFRLYAATAPSTVLASVTVTRQPLSSGEEGPAGPSAFLSLAAYKYNSGRFAAWVL